MAVVALVFSGVLAIILGAFWALVLRPEAAEHRTLQKRMAPSDPTKRSKRLMLSPEDQRGISIPGLGAMQKAIDQSGIRATVVSLLVMCLGSGFILGFIAFVFTRNVPAGAAVGFVALFVPYMAVKQLASRRMWKFEEQFPEAIDLIARALRAGHSFPTGLSMVADELGSPVGPEFKLLYDRQNFGMALEDALRAFATRVPILDARFFATAVLTQREAGGNLAGVLDNLSSVIRERFKVKRQVRVVSAHGRMTAAILSGLPPVVAVAQFFISPDTSRLLLTDNIGHIMLATAVTLQLVGMLIIRKIVNVEY